MHGAVVRTPGWVPGEHDRILSRKAQPRDVVCTAAPPSEEWLRQQLAARGVGTGKLFTLMSTDKKAAVTRLEFESGLRALDIDAGVKGFGRLFKAADVNDDKSVTIEELRAFLEPEKYTLNQSGTVTKREREREKKHRPPPHPGDVDAADEPPRDVAWLQRKLEKKGVGADALFHALNHGSEWLTFVEFIKGLKKVRVKGSIVQMRRLFEARPS